MDIFAPYSHAIAALAATACLLLIMGPLAGMMKARHKLPPGSSPEADYGNATYRWHRAYGNLSESIGPFVAVTLAAILAGASPFWVNLLAALFAMIRLVLLIVHVKGIGRPDMGPRSFIYMAGWLVCLSLAAMAIVQTIGG